MKTRETRIRVETLSVEGAGFEEALFRRALAERVTEAGDRKDATEAAIVEAARAASKGVRR